MRIATILYYRPLILVPWLSLAAQVQVLILDLWSTIFLESGATANVPPFIVGVTDISLNPEAAYLQA
jgi:hypothetical protein